MSRRTRKRGCVWLPLLFLVVLLAAFPLWLAALAGYLIRDEAPVKSDVIIVLAGDPSGERIRKGGDLVRAGFAPVALVSGPYGTYGLHESDLAIPFAIRSGYAQALFSPFPNTAKSTAEEAIAFRAELRRRNAHRILIVTSNYHTRRAGNIFRAAAPEMEFHTTAAPDQHFSAAGWWRDREGRKIVIIEWMKTVATWMNL